MSKITSKGQVTIPEAIRERFGLRPGLEVEFVVEDGRVVVRRASPLSALDRWTGALSLEDGVDDFVSSMRGAKGKKRREDRR